MTIMNLMNEKEYTQACLFRIREALTTTQAWWEQNLTLDRTKIEQTIDMLEDTIDELRYFSEKIDMPRDTHHDDRLISAGLFKE